MKKFWGMRWFTSAGELASAIAFTWKIDLHLMYLYMYMYLLQAPAHSIYSSSNLLQSWRRRRTPS